jgi:hypothetical protein
VYELTVHSSSLTDAPKCCRMVFSAMVTTSMSNMTMKAAAEVSASVHRCLDVVRVVVIPGHTGTGRDIGRRRTDESPPSGW